jgi:hypothetical protein
MLAAFLRGNSNNALFGLIVITFLSLTFTDQKIDDYHFTIPEAPMT